MASSDVDQLMLLILLDEDDVLELDDDDDDVELLPYVFKDLISNCGWHAVSHSSTSKGVSTHIGSIVITCIQHVRRIARVGACERWTSCRLQRIRSTSP